MRRPPSSIDPELAARDEAFWRRQEKRRERGMGQPCCTQSGVSWSLIDVPGDFAVVVHGEYDCTNCFHHHIGRSARRFYSTRLTEAQLTRGETAAPLRRCLELIAREERPPMVVVLGTCPVEVIGDPFFDVVARVSAETGVPMVPMRTSGLKLTSQREMLDWLYATLAENAPAAATLSGVNLFGLPSPRLGVSEPVRLLRHAGVNVRASLPQGATWDDWMAVRQAAVTAVVDRSMFPRVLSLLEDGGQRIVEVPQPVGVEACRQLYAGLDEATDGALAGVVERELSQAQSALEATRIQGRRVGIAIRMLNAYKVEALVHQGLGEVPAFLEAGLDVELLIQGAPDPDAEKAFAAALDARGFGHLPRHIFPGPWALPALLKQQRYDLVSIADSSHHAALEADVPYLPTGALRPYLEGVAGNLRMLSERLGSRR